MGRRRALHETRGSSPRVRGTPPDALRGLRHRRFIPACAGNSGLVEVPCWALPVHPRVCGELGQQRVPDHDVAGSSPRVRGTLQLLHAHAAQLRFIPACAGNSSSSSGRRCCTTVHPRVCGELDMEPLPGRWAIGSSPRVRGTRPACTPTPSQATVHPRVCGELGFPRSRGRSMSGSSPRVRGTRPRRLRRRARARFIPACAGNSTTAGWRARPDGGSSPRVRGTRRAGRRQRLGRRFIPACAGNSRRACGSGAGSAVHPRVCGELCASWPGTAVPVGSSPRVRGTRVSAERLPFRRRFIPACAGNSFLSVSRTADLIGSSPRVRGTRSPTARRRRRPAVHPRVCGELHLECQSAHSNSGSSPRVRGTRRRRLRPARATRFIPACAGNSAWLRRA